MGISKKNGTLKTSVWTGFNKGTIYRGSEQPWSSNGKDTYHT